MKQGATQPYNADDFLIIDSYDGNLEKGGVTNTFNQNRSVWTYSEGYHYLNSDHGYKKYTFS